MNQIASIAIAAALSVGTLFTGVTATQPPVTYPVEIPQTTITPDEEEPAIPELIDQYAAEYNVSRSAIYGTIRNETAGTFDPDIQSQKRYEYVNPRWLKNCPDLQVGDQERSYGLAQIHICDHNVTPEQARDPEFAIEFMAKHFAMGRQSWWMAYSSS